jgi:carboxyl-terminal processing protease
MGDGRAIKLTTAHYLTPNGRFIHGQGIKPDIIVEPSSQGIEGSDKQITQAILTLKQS